MEKKIKPNCNEGFTMKNNSHLPLPLPHLLLLRDIYVYLFSAFSSKASLNIFLYNFSLTYSLQTLPSDFWL